MMKPEERYLELLKASILNEIYLDDELRILYLRKCLAGQDSFAYSVLHDIRAERDTLFRELKTSRESGYFVGRDIHNCGFSHTMIGRKRLDNLHHCLDIIRREHVPGDLSECGVWRGGATIFMRGYLEIYAMADRVVWAADSFAGLPKSSLDADKDIDLSPERFPELAVSLKTVKDNFRLYGLLDNRVRFLEGWFRDTLAPAPIDQLALLRLDGDLYESTFDSLNALYDKLVVGGFLIIDDYYVLPVCAQAVTDFFDARGLKPDFAQIDQSAVYWRKR